MTERVAADAHGPNVRIRRFPDPVRDRKMTIDLEPIDPPVLFLPPDAVGLRVHSRGSGGGSAATPSHASRTAASSRSENGQEKLSTRVSAG